MSDALHVTLTEKIFHVWVIHKTRLDVNLYSNFVEHAKSHARRSFRKWLIMLIIIE